MNITEFILQSEEIIKCLAEGINRSEISLKEAEERILEHVNRLWHIMVDEVVERISEPVYENRVVIEGKEAVYDGMRNMRFINRFGGVTAKSRRCYKYIEHRGGYYPLDEKLGVDRCSGFSPLMTYLQALFGCCESYVRSTELLSGSIGFKVSGTAIERKTEVTGALIGDMPYRMVPEEKRAES